jgi:hypothetical protein
MRLRVLMLCGLMVLAMLAACSGSNTRTDTENSATSSMAESAADTDPTPTPTPTPAGPPLGDEQVIAEAGYAFRPLAGWTVEVQGGVAGMRPPDADPETGPSIAITVGNLEQLNIEEVSSRSLETSQDFFEAVRSGIQRETLSITFEEPQSATVDGYDAYAAPFQSTGFANLETEVAGQVSAALIEEERGFVMFGIATPPDQWQHTAEFEAVRDTVRILPVPTTTPTPATTPTPSPTE